MFKEGDVIQFEYHHQQIVGTLKECAPAKVSFQDGQAFFDLTVKIGSTTKLYRSIADEEIQLVKTATHH